MEKYQEKKYLELKQKKMFLHYNDLEVGYIVDEIEDPWKLITENTVVEYDYEVYIKDVADIVLEEIGKEYDELCYELGYTEDTIDNITREDFWAIWCYIAENLDKYLARKEIYAAVLDNFRDEAIEDWESKYEETYKDNLDWYEENWPNLK